MASVREKLDTIEEGARRTLVRGVIPAIADAQDDVFYGEADSDNIVSRIVFKQYRKTPFFAVTVANLGDGHRGYAGSGYGSLDNGYDVDAGGSAGYSELGAVSEHHNSILSPAFERVGTYTIPDTDGSSQLGLASDGTTLYYSVESGGGGRVRGFNPETGVQTFESDVASTANSIRHSLAIYNGLGYVFDGQDDDFYTFNLTTGVDTRLSNTNFSGFIYGLAVLNNIIYAIGFSTGTAHRIFTVNPTTGAVSELGTISGLPSDEYIPQSLTAVGGVLYAIYRDPSPRSQKLFILNPTTRVATEVGDVSPANQQFTGLAEVGDTLYAWNDDDEGIYRSTRGIGNRWEVLFPSDTTEVATGDTTLKLFTERGGDEIELTRDTGITDAVAFASENDGAAAHTINVGDNLDIALYKEDGTQLFEGDAEPYFENVWAA